MSFLPPPLFAALLGALAGAAEGFVLAIVIATSQQRRGYKSAPAFLAQMLFGSLSGAIVAALATRWLAPLGAAGIGALAWPCFLGAIALVLALSKR
jgi:hypothetical protein